MPDHSMSLLKQIQSLIPQQEPFLFVDELLELSHDHVLGTYTYPPDSYFYQGHFPGNPITPGVILIETMAQIGLLSLGIYVSESHINKTSQAFAFSSAQVEFYKQVLPGDKVWVESKKIYFRLGKLKCNVWMSNAAGEKLCKGELSGMLLKKAMD